MAKKRPIGPMVPTKPKHEPCWPECIYRRQLDMARDMIATWVREGQAGTAVLREIGEMLGVRP